jgi:hypothetical protein
MIDVDTDDDADEDLEDRVVGLEDKLDELMAEFEDLMGQVDDNTDEIEDEHGEEEVDIDVDDMAGDDMDVDVDMEEQFESLEEGVDLVAAPKPVTTSDSSKSPVAANSGAKGMDAKPVSTDTAAESGRPTPKSTDQGNTTKPDVKPAPKPDLAQASGVNTKSPIA